jgi:hypothetical protein
MKLLDLHSKIRSFKVKRFDIRFNLREVFVFWGLGDWTCRGKKDSLENIKEEDVRNKSRCSNPRWKLNYCYFINKHSCQTMFVFINT